jgi:hypothetical protein
LLDLVGREENRGEKARVVRPRPLTGSKSILALTRALSSIEAIYRYLARCSRRKDV